MAAFSYQALEASGKRVKGVQEGDSERQVRAKLRERGLKPIEVKSVSQRHGQSKNSPVEVSRLKLSLADLTLLSRQLSTLVQSNLPLADALQAVAQQSQKAKVQSMVLQVRSRVLEGHTLAYALAEFPKVFDHLFRSMVSAGEHAGFLGIVLERLADYIETAQATRNKIRMAMLYPVMLVIVATAVIAGLMTYVVPELVRIFTSAQADLPALTKGLIATSDYMADYGLYTLIGVLASLYGFRRLISAPGRRKTWHRFLLATPGIRGFLRGAETARFASTLSILIASGVPLLEALRIAANVRPS
jgi:general secretion pathway protein F